MKPYLINSGDCYRRGHPAQNDRRIPYKSGVLRRSSSRYPEAVDESSQHSSSPGRHHGRTGQDRDLPADAPGRLRSVRGRRCDPSHPAGVLLQWHHWRTQGHPAEISLCPAEWGLVRLFAV